jgi:hypothetical protein
VQKERERRAREGGLKGLAAVVAGQSMLSAATPSLPNALVQPPPGVTRVGTRTVDLHAAFGRRPRRAAGRGSSRSWTDSGSGGRPSSRPTCSCGKRWRFSA